MVVSTVNNGAVPDLPNEQVVEVSSQIGASGAVPMAFGPFSPAERGWLQVMKNMELITVQAAVTGDYGLALQAFILNPLIPSGQKAKDLLDEMLVANKKYLPQFSGKIKELVDAGVKVHDQIAANIDNTI